MGVNKVFLIGRTVRDIETFTTQNDKVIAKTCIAVDEGYGEKKTTQFINLVAFGGTADFMVKYVEKGKLVSVVGRINIGQYTKKDGTKQSTFDVVVEDLQALERRNSTGTKEVAPSGFAEINEQIPF